MPAAELNRGRRIAVWSLIVAAAPCAVLTVLAVRQLLDETRWHDATTALVADPAVQSALANSLVDQIDDNAGPAAQLQAVLPPLAGPAFGALPIAILLVVGAWLAGPAGWARRFRAVLADGRSPAADRAGA